MNPIQHCIRCGGRMDRRVPKHDDLVIPVVRHRLVPGPADRREWLGRHSLRFEASRIEEVVTLRDHAEGSALVEVFDGVPERVRIDNLKAAIVRACLEEPQAQLAYRECAEHYDFLITPCLPRQPKHKGKVEQGGVHYVKRNFLGGRKPTTITQANRDVCRWVETTAGLRIHGTTKEKPLERFETERAALRPLPGVPYDLAIWKQAKLHRDCYVVFEQSYYSAPFRLVGQPLWVRGGTQSVQIYTSDYQLVATHTRALKPGQRLMGLDVGTKTIGIALSDTSIKSHSS